MKILNRKRSTVADRTRKRISSSIAKKKFWEKFDSIEEKLESKVEPPKAPSTIYLHEHAQRLLFQFTEQYMQRKSIQGCVEDFLKTPPQRPFWKLYLRYTCLPNLRPITSKDGVLQQKNGLTTSTVGSRFLMTLAVYKHLFGISPEPADIQECWALLNNRDFQEECRLRSPQLQSWTSFETCKTIIEHGVFGNLWSFKNGRERLQFTALLLLLAFTAARPGEILCSPGYEIDVAGLLYGDLVFYADKLTNGCTSLAVDVRIRNLKGLRNTEAAYRTQPIYQDHANLAPMYDATLLLAILAIMDQAFEDFETIEECLLIDPEQLEQTIDPNSTRKRTVLAIKESKKGLPVFRQAVMQDGRWETSSTLIWQYQNAKYLVQRITEKMGITNFTMYSIRRACATALNNWEVTENDAQLIMGHRMGTATYQKHYVSKRTQIDIQGLASVGRESRERLVNTSVQRTPQVPLSIPELEAIEKDPTLEKAKVALEEHNKKRQTLFQSNRDEFSALHVSKASEVPLSGSFKYQTPVTETLKKALIKFTNAAHRVVALRTLLRQRARQLKSLENRNQIRKDTIASSISVTDDQKATVSTMELMADLIGTSDEDTMNDADICQAENTPPTSHIRDQTAIKLASTFLTMKHRYEDALGAKPNFDGLFQVRDDIAVAAAQAYTSLSSGYGTRTIRHTGHCSSCGLKHPRLSYRKDALSHYILCTKGKILSEIKGMEEYQGKSNPRKPNVIFCVEHLEWLIGDDQVEEHFTRHLDTKTLETLPADEQHQICPYCWHDTSLPSPKRAKVWPRELHLHILNCHLLKIKDHVSKCPVCNGEYPLKFLPDHLIDHQYHLAGNVGVIDLPRHCNGDLEVLRSCSGVNIKRLEEWIQYVSLIPPQVQLRMESIDNQIDKQDNLKKLPIVPLADISNQPHTPLQQTLSKSNDF